MTSTPTAADVIASTLAAAGVDVVFALPGEENLAVVGALARHDIELVVCRHEQHASFMAVAHARLTGDLAVCLATLGPGALNLFTGLAQAQLLRVPVLALTGQKPLRDNDEGPFQVLDVVGSAAPLIEAATTIADGSTAGETIANAIETARRERAAVLVEIPEDTAGHPGGRVAPVTVDPFGPEASSAAVDRLGDLIHQAARPLLLAGSGCNDPRIGSALARACARTGLGVVTTQMGKGALGWNDPATIGTLGMHRPDYISAVIDDADLVVAVGYHPAEHPPLAWHRSEAQPVVHVDVAAPHVVAGYAPAHSIVGDLASTLERLATTTDRRWLEPYRRAIRECLADEATSFAADSAARVPELVRTAVDIDTVVALDNGLYKIWFARRFEVGAPHGLMMDNALATMGAGLATGMAAARLGRNAVVVTGDGGFLMHAPELETAQRLGLELTIVVLRDDAYGFIEWHQDEQDRDNVGVHLGNPDIAALATAFGARGVTLEGPDGLSDALATSEGLTVIDCPIDYRCNEILERDDLPDRVRSRL